ncbi:MAG: toll/interleukin-1 receptor domain-containing protein [Syntrophobacteraceae bacterium]
MANVFFSYSHRDEDLRDELEIHLSALKRQGFIETWHDRRIGAGKNVDPEIDANLEAADIILLLVSSYFIASDYCYDLEMNRAIERHNAGDARVIPVILRPCDWQHTPFGNLRATPPDGKPVSRFADQNDAFLLVAKDIRRVVEEMSRGRSTDKKNVQFAHAEQPKLVTKPRSSNLRIKREFSDIDRSRFLSETLEYLANFFENSLMELESRASGIETEFRRIDANRFTSAVYRGGKLISQCKIWLGTDHFSSGEIRYSSGSFSDNSWNESVSVEDDGYSLGLRSLGMHRVFRQGGTHSMLTQEGAAELFWSMLIEQLQ